MTKFEQLCNEYRENKRLIEELEAMNNDLKNRIIELMEGEDTKIEGSTKAVYKIVENYRFNSATFKKEQLPLYQKYLVKSSYKRFSIC